MLRAAAGEALATERVNAPCSAKGAARLGLGVWWLCAIKRATTDWASAAGNGSDTAIAANAAGAAAGGKTAWEAYSMVLTSLAF